MRLSHLLSIFCLLFGAYASSFDSRAPAAHPLDARDLLDVCASVNTELVVPDLLGGILTAAGAISQFKVPLSQPIFQVSLIVLLTDVCLCLSALPLFLETNVVALLAVTIAGEPVTSDVLTNLVWTKCRTVPIKIPDGVFF